MKTSLPKLAKDLASLIGISRKETNLDALATALDDARLQVEAATTAREAADATYRESILDASPAELEKLQAAKGRAVVELDRTEALVAALTNRIANVRTDQERTARKAIHADAVAKCDAIRARLPEEYRHHALAIRALLRDLAEAEVARQRAEEEAPEFAPISSPEAEVRGLFSVPEEVIDRREVELWAYPGHTEPLPDDVQRKVQQQGKPGHGYYKQPGHGVPRDCRLRRFAVVRFREQIASPWSGDHLHRDVRLPGLHPFDDAFCDGRHRHHHTLALDELSADLKRYTPGERPMLTRVEVLPDPPRTDGAGNVVVPLSSAA